MQCSLSHPAQSGSRRASLERDKTRLPRHLIANNMKLMGDLGKQDASAGKQSGCKGGF